MRLLAEISKEEFSDGADFLEKLRYVDDMAKSASPKEEATKIIEYTKKVLKIVQMKVKGWSVTGQEPSTELSEDGVSVGIGGMTLMFSS